MNLSLYNIAQEYRMMVEKLMDSTDDAQTIADTIEAESFDLETKTVNIAYAIKNIDATIVALKHVAQENANRIKSLENRAAGLRAYTIDCLDFAGVDKILGYHFEIKLRNNPPSVDIFDADQLPVEYMRQPDLPPMVPDKAAIKAAISVNSNVPGARLIQTKRIEIK